MLRRVHVNFILGSEKFLCKRGFILGSLLFLEVDEFVDKVWVSSLIWVLTAVNELLLPKLGIFFYFLKNS